MLREKKLRALDACKRARVRVPDYERWKEPGGLIAPGNQVNIRVMPSSPISFART